MLIKFNANYKYSGYEFLKDVVYNLSEENGFAARWIKRGCVEVPEFDGKVIADPFHTVVSIKEESVVSVEEVEVAPVEVEVVGENYVEVSEKPKHNKGKSNKR